MICLVTIEKLVYGGDGLSRVESRVVLTPFVLPGETVRAEITPARKDLLRGKLIEVVDSSPHRVTPPCPYFYQCGGCQYQHAAYEFQLEQKKAILREVLRRVGKIDFHDEIGVISGEPWAYRNRTQLHIDRGAIGYFEAGSHTLCAIDHCPISSPRLNEAIGHLARQLPGYRSFTASVELFTNASAVQFNLFDRVPASVLPLFREIGTMDPIVYGPFRVSRQSFFQVNRFLIDQLVQTVLGDTSGHSALDLYAGVGLFADRLTRSFSKVIAVEPGGSAFRDLEHNLQDRATLVRSSAEDYLATLSEAPDLIVADPPRAGLGKIVVNRLVNLRAAALTIVSCDPATLARDLGPLLAAGYRIEKLTLVDLFPQTYHLETVVHLVSTSVSVLESQTDEHVLRIDLGP